jgi:hypothetical protein
MKETVDTLFDYAIELEKAAEDLYRNMAQLFSTEPKVVRFWEQYANEERGHAAYLERVRKAMSPDELSKPAKKSILVQAHRSLQGTSQVDLRKVRNLEDAYQLALDVENSETNAIFDFMISNFSTGELAKSYKFLKMQLNLHVTKMEREFPAPYKSRSHREKLTAQGN